MRDERNHVSAATENAEDVIVMWAAEALGVSVLDGEKRGVKMVKCVRAGVRPANQVRQYK